MESVKIYVFRDEHDSIVAMNSSYILGDDENYEVYKEVTEDDPDFELAKYAQSQEYVRKMMGQYLLDENLRPNYYKDFQWRSEEEKTLLYPNPIPEPEPSELDKLKKQQELTDQAVQDLILMMMGGGE